MAADKEVRLVSGWEANSAGSRKALDVAAIRESTIFIAILECMFLGT